MTDQRYILDSDNDGHKFLVPVEQIDAWNQWVEDIADYWRIGSDRPDTEPEPKRPEGVISIGCSTQLVTFANVEIRGEPV